MVNKKVYNKEKFGVNLKKLRKNKGYSQENFAELTSVSDRMVRNWESGVHFPRIDKLIDICIILNTSPDGILQ